MITPLTPSQAPVRPQGQRPVGEGRRAPIAIALLAAILVAVAGRRPGAGETRTPGPVAPALAAARAPATAGSAAFPHAPAMRGRLAYARTDDNVWNIYVADADGQDETRVTAVDDTSWQEHVRWSADGSALAYDLYPGDATYSVWRVSLDGSSPLRVAMDGNLTDPAWRPAAGGELAFAKREGRDAALPHDIYLAAGDITSEDANFRPLAAAPGVDERGPDWSPDGTRLAYERKTEDGDWDIWVMDADGGNSHPLVALSETHERVPRWEPTGRRIAFISGSFQLGVGKLMVLDLDTAKFRALVEPADGPLAWSPDGGRIVFHNPRIDGPTPLAGESTAQDDSQVGLYLVDADSGDIWRLKGPAGGRGGNTEYGGYAPDWWAPAPTLTPTPTATRNRYLPGRIARLPMALNGADTKGHTATPTPEASATAPGGEPPSPSPMASGEHTATAAATAAPVTPGP